jgi:hypothetical protein
MNLQSVIEKVTELCCAGDTKTTGTSTTSQTESSKEDVLEEPKPVATSTVQPTTSVESKPTTKSSFTDHETKHEFLLWSELSPSLQQAATALGFDSTMWDADGHSAEAWWKHWKDLTEEERCGAEALGWDKDAWDHKYEHCTFKDIPEAVKRAAQSVGFTETMWDDDTWPETTKHKSWSELTEEEQRAFTVFGYTEPTWDH